MYDHILKGIDDQIAQLTAAKALLAPTDARITNAVAFANSRLSKKRVMSEQGRANIAAGQRKRRKLAKLAKKPLQKVTASNSQYGNS